MFLAFVFIGAVAVAVVVATSTSTTVVRFRNTVTKDTQTAVSDIQSFINQYTK
jgi:hypothetical protein